MEKKYILLLPAFWALVGCGPKLPDCASTESTALVAKIIDQVVVKRSSGMLSPGDVSPAITLSNIETVSKSADPKSYSCKADITIKYSAGIESKVFEMISMDRGDQDTYLKQVGGLLSYAPVMAMQTLIYAAVGSDLVLNTGTAQDKRAIVDSAIKKLTQSQARTSYQIASIEKGVDGSNFRVEAKVDNFEAPTLLLAVQKMPVPKPTAQPPAVTAAAVPEAAASVVAAESPPPAAAPIAQSASQQAAVDSKPSPSAAATPFGSPSFDCGKASSVQEKLICSSAELAAADRELAIAYARANSKDGDREKMRADQRSWLTQIRNKCTDEACLLKSYKDRTSQLGAV